jgi:hypothetical protein
VYIRTYINTHISCSDIKMMLHFSHGLCLCVSYIYLGMNDCFIKNTNQFVSVMKAQCDDYHLPEDDNHHSHRRGNFKSYKAQCVF